MKVATIVNKSRATKTGWFYQYTFVLSRVIQKRLWILERPCIKIIYSSGHDAITVGFFELAFALSDSGTPMGNSGITLAL